MAISSTTNRANYTGDGSTSAYSYSYYIQDEDDLTVTVADTDGDETTLTKTTDYTVSGVGAANGGTVTLVNASQAWLTSGSLKSGYAITIRRVLDLTQPTDIRNQGTFFPETHEDQFDREVMIAQQLQDQLNRCVKFRETSTTTNIEMPEPEASKVIAWNSDGDEMELISRGSLATATIQQGNAAINSGTSTVSVSFDQAFDDALYSLTHTLQNTTDGSPQFLSVLITAKSATGFTATLNAAVDSANYILSWTATRET